jgi:N-acetylmuramoyl-L-alanine amidase
MARRWWLLLAGAPLAAALWAAGAAESVPISIRLFGYDRGTGDVVAYSDGPISGKGFPLREPARWVVDIPNAVYTGALKTLAAVPGSGIKQIRIGQFTRSDVRVVFDLEEAFEIPLRAETRQTKSAPSFRLVFDLPSPRTATEVAHAPAAKPRATTKPEPIRKVKQAKLVPPPPLDQRPESAPGAAPGSALGSALGSASASVRGPASPTATEAPAAAVAPATAAAPATATDPWTWLSDMFAPNPQLGTFGGPATYADPHEHELSAKGEEPKPVPVSGLTLRRAGKGWIMRITADKPIDYKLARMGRRDRVYVDMSGGTVDIPRESMYVDNGLAARVRKAATLENGTRIVLELDQPMRYEAHLSADKRAVILALSRSEPRTIPGQNDDRITIDPGHGGLDPGTIGPAGTYEKSVNLAISTKVASMLEKAGLDVQMTRSKDTDLMLWPRVDMGEEFKSDAFVSIHMNSAPNRATQGVETYYFTPESIPLAGRIHRKLVAALGQPDRGVRRAQFVVVKYSRMPAVLVEVGYLSNPREESLLVSPEYQQKAAEGILSGIQDFMRDRVARR